MEGSENKTAFNIYEFERIPVADELKQVIYATEKSIAVNTLHECNIIDLKTKEVFRLHYGNLNRNAKEGLVLHAGKIIADLGEKVMIYDIQTTEQAYLDERVLGIIPISKTESVFFTLTGEKRRNKVIEYNCKMREVKDVKMTNQSSKMKVHPSGKIICIPRYRNLIFYTLDNLSKSRHVFVLDRINWACYCEYNFQGFIAVGDTQKINIVNSRENELHSFIETKPCESFGCVRFHPDQKHLAILTNRHKKNEYKACIKFFNIPASKYINTIKLGFGKGIDFSFSDNGLKFVAGLEKECLWGFVPFAVEKECVNLLCWLYKFKEQGKIPHDIVRHCLSVFLKEYIF